MRQDANDDIEALAEAVGVLRRVSPLRYEPPINTCAAPGCGMPMTGVFCLSCATAGINAVPLERDRRHLPIAGCAHGTVYYAPTRIATCTDCGAQWTF